MSKSKETKHGRGDRFDGFRFDPDELVIIGRDTKDGPEHPLYDPRGLRNFDEQTVKTIMSDGVLQTITFKRDGERTLVLAGRGRVIDAREANRRLRDLGRPIVKVPGLPRSGDDASLYRLARIENSHRTEDGPLEVASYAKHMLEAFQMSVDDIATTLKRPVSTIRAYLKLDGCSPAVRNAVAAGPLSATAAAKLASLPHSEQDQQLAELVKDGAKPSARRVIDKVRETEGKDPVQTPAVRIKAAAEILARIAPRISEELDLVIAAGGIDAGIVSDLSRLAHLITGKTLDELTTNTKAAA